MRLFTLFEGIDQDAAGFGWNVQDPKNGSSTGVDLLSVVMHEMGHVLGYDHHDVMGASLDVGLRNLDWLYSNPDLAHDQVRYGRRPEFP